MGEILKVDFVDSDEHFSKNLIYKFIDLCEDCIEVIELTPQQIYDREYGYAAKISAHFRHIYERIESFVEGVEKGIVSYHIRMRNKDLEKKENIEKAFSDLQQRFEYQEFFRYDLEVQEYVSINGKTQIFHSNFEREILYLCDHTIHHLAMVKMILNQEGIKIDEQIGKDLSTLIFENS